MISTVSKTKKAVSNRVSLSLTGDRKFSTLSSGAATVIQWIVNYFDSDTSGIHRIPSTSINDVLGKATPVVASQLMPVILQHRGHSRLIVGYQRDAEGITSLLTFDTGR